MINETASTIEAGADASRVPPHAKAFAERARKLEALPLGDLAQRVALGLARLRADFGLEPRSTDALGALFAALPDTDVARRGVELQGELAELVSSLERERDVARAHALERERIAADVERRSESLKEALRERSADLAAAIARAEAGDVARRELAALNVRATELAATLEHLRAEHRGLEAALARAADDHLAEMAQASVEGEERARLQREVESLTSELRARHRDAESAQDALRVAQEESCAALAEMESRVASQRDERTGSLLDAAEARLRAVRDVLEADRATWIARDTAHAEEVRHLVRERDALAAEIAVVRTNSQRVDRSRQEALDDAQRVLAEMRGKLAESERELAWRTREMDALRDASGGVRWKLLGGDALQRVARWSERERKGGST